MDEQFEDWVFIVPGSLLRAIAERDDVDRDQVPETATEARQKRILNRRLDAFFLRDE